MSDSASTAERAMRLLRSVGPWSKLGLVAGMILKQERLLAKIRADNV